MKTCKDCIHYEVCHIVEMSDKEELEEEKFSCCDFKDKSKFIELPCSIGDKLYDVRTNYKNVRTDVVREFEICAIDVSFVPWETWCTKDAHIYELGKTVFTTREEAQMKLEEIKNA